MNLKKLLLPLTFLGLSPTARAADTNTNQTDSVPKTQQNADFSKITLIPQKTIDFMDAQEDLWRRTTEDSDTKKEMSDVHNKLINTYNATPYKYNIDNIISLLDKVSDPDIFYQKLHLSIPHAKYLMANITPELQSKLHIQNKTDILITAINHRAHTMSDREAFDFAVEGKYFDTIAEPAVVLHKALQIPLQNTDKIGVYPSYRKCIQNIADFVLLNQNNPEIVKLYSDIFITTAQIIREYNEKTDTQEQYVITMNILVPLVERYNAQIIPNSVLDQEIKIKKPHDYVINQYDEIFFRISLAKIYNDAYFKYIIQSPRLRQAPYSNSKINQVYFNYVDAINLQTIARNDKLTPEQQTQLNNLMKQHPEIRLFDTYFSNAYFNIKDRKEIMDFIAKVKFSKTKQYTVPIKIKKLLQQMQDSLDAQNKLIHENLINMPDLQLTFQNTVSYAEIMYKSNFTPTNAHNRIDSTLSKQHNDVSMQKMSLERITQNTNINPVMIQKERQ